MGLPLEPWACPAGWHFHPVMTVSHHTGQCAESIGTVGPMTVPGGLSHPGGATVASADRTVRGLGPADLGRSVDTGDWGLWGDVAQERGCWVPSEERPSRQG